MMKSEEMKMVTESLIEAFVKETVDFSTILGWNQKDLDNLRLANEVLEKYFDLLKKFEAAVGLIKDMKYRMDNMEGVLGHVERVVETIEARKEV